MADDYGFGLIVGAGIGLLLGIEQPPKIAAATGLIILFVCGLIRISQAQS